MMLDARRLMLDTEGFASGLTFCEADDTIIRTRVTTQVDRLKAFREKRILKPCLMQESHSAKILQSCFSDPFSLQPKSLQPDYVSSYEYRVSIYSEAIKIDTGATAAFCTKKCY